MKKYLGVWNRKVYSYQELPPPPPKPPPENPPPELKPPPEDTVRGIEVKVELMELMDRFKSWIKLSMINAPV
jgi:hypothetical protein